MVNTTSMTLRALVRPGRRVRRGASCSSYWPQGRFSIYHLILYSACICTRNSAKRLKSRANNGKHMASAIWREFFDDVTHLTKEAVDGTVKLRAHSVNFDNCPLVFCDITIPECRAIFRTQRTRHSLGVSRQFGHWFRWILIEMTWDGTFEGQIYTQQHRHQSVSSYRHRGFLI